MLPGGLTSLLDSSKNKAIAAAGPAAAAPAAAAGGAAGAAPMPSKQLHSEVRVGGCETANTMVLKDGTTSKNMLSRGLTSLLDSGKNKAIAAAGPAAAAAPAAAGGAAGAAPMPSKQLHSQVLAGGCETAKHHGPEGRNDLQKHAVPRLDVPSGFW